MKKFLAIAALALGSVLHAQSAQSVPVALTNGNDTAGYADLSTTIQSAIPTPYADLRNYVFKIHTTEISFNGALPSACTARLEGSSNGYFWYDLSGPQTCTTNVMFHVDQKPVRFVRVFFITFTGTSPASVYYTGSR